MKEKVLLAVIILFVSIANPNVVYAEEAIVKDVNITARGSIVKISITANQPLQMETFKSEEGKLNYLVLDFLGTVYTELPAIVEVESLVVEKVNLVRGEEQSVMLDGKEYNTLDFIAINLNPGADYKVTQTQAVIDLNISMGRATGAQDDIVEDKPVDLEPPIVITSRKGKKAAVSEYVPEVREKKREAFSYGDEELIERKQTSRKKVERKRKKRRGFLWFGRKKRVDDSEPIREESSVSRKTYTSNDSVNTSKNSYLIDKVVKDTIKEKDHANSRIENLTFELQKMQKELNMSKGQKMDLDSKISAILSKLDSLNDALEDEIRRRKALGEQVDDLKEKRTSYLETKKKYEALAKKIAYARDKVDSMNEEIDSIEGRLYNVKTEENRLNEAFSDKRMEYSQINSDYDKAKKQSKMATGKSSDLRIKLEQIKAQLAETLRESDSLAIRVNDLEGKKQFAEADMDRLKIKLSDRMMLVEELEIKQGILNREIEEAILEKEKIDRDYQSAKINYEKIRREIELIVNK